VLQDEVAVEEDGLDLGEHGVVAVEMRPAGLDHADVGLCEVMDDAHEPVGGRDEIGVEDGDELAFGYVEAFVERAGFEAVAVGAMDIDDGMAERGVALDDFCGDLLGFVGGVVENLDFQAVARVVDGADGFDEAVDDKLLIVHGELDGDAGQLREVLGRIGIVVFAVLEIEVDERVAVQAVDGEQDHDGEVRDEERGVKGVPAIEVVEGGVCPLVAPVMEGLGEAVLWREGYGCQTGEVREAGLNVAGERGEQGLSLQMG
jgi:hypothetical protein